MTGRSSDTILVVQFLREGDARAFSQLVERHYGAVYRYACALVRDWCEAEDLTQEAFLKAHAQIQTLNDPAKFGAWVRRILFHLAMDWQRQYRPQFFRYIDTLEDGVAANEGLVDGAVDPLERLLRSELMAEIETATADLPDKYRLPFALYHLEHLGYEAIADELDLPLNTVKSLLHRARGRLQDRLRPYVEQAPVWTTLALRFDCLPSAQGWTYQAGYETLPGHPAESRTFSLKNGVLTLDNADLFPDNIAAYVMYGVVDPTRPFVLSARLRKLRETARFPEYCVGARPAASDPLRNCGFSLGVFTGSERFALDIGVHQLRCGARILSSAVDGGEFHDYRMECTPSAGYRLYVDGDYVAEVPSQRHLNRNQVAFGDLTPCAGNAHVEITSLHFTQMCTTDVVTAPREESYDGAELVRARPFDGLGFLQTAFPTECGERAKQSEKQLIAVLRRHSRRWALAPGEGLSPRDFAGG